MSKKTNIAWCDSTGNPWIGCTKISPGCAGCYAAELDRTRFSRTMGGGTKEKPISHWGKGAPRLRTKGFWKDAVRWNREADGKDRIVCGDCAQKRGLVELCRRAATHTFAGMGAQSNCSLCGKPHGGASIVLPRPRIFPSLCDWLDEEVPIEWLSDFLKLIHDTQNLDWLLLTKRPENFYPLLKMAWRTAAYTRLGQWLADWTENGKPPRNVWLGTSVEDQPRDQRISALLHIPARIRFLSIEPLLGPVKLPEVIKPETGHRWMGTNDAGIDWVIVGGESGPKARPCDVEWVRSIVRQCRSDGVPCFVKQLGEHAVIRNDSYDECWPGSTIPIREDYKPTHQGELAPLRFLHKKGGNPAEWPDDLRQERLFPT